MQELLVLPSQPQIHQGSESDVDLTVEKAGGERRKLFTSKSKAAVIRRERQVQFLKRRG